MSRKKILLIAVLCAAGGALAMGSATYLLQPSVMDNGGGYAASSTYEQRGSIGATVIGDAPSATSTTYKMDVGYISTSGGSGSVSWLLIDQPPTPGTIGLGGTSQIKWTSSIAGNYRIERGGTGVPMSGTLITSGTCTASVQVTNNIAETNLTANASNTVYVIVVGTSTGAKSVTMTSDRLVPTMAPTQVTVAGTCDDVTVANVVINGTALPVTAGAYTGTVTTGMDTITIVATNASSQSVTRTVKVQ